MLTDDIKKRFGTAVRSRRKRLGISQEELAGRAGLHRTYVADIERGARNLSLANIEKLAKGLETSIPTLFTPDPLARGTAEHPQDILLVEDDPGDVDLTLRAFKKACVTNRVRLVHDGEEALDYLFCTGAYSQRSKEEMPQVVLLDLSLPKLNGLEVLRRIKADQRTRSIPVVVLSASEWGRDVEETKKLGAEGIVTKPVDFQRFSLVTPQLRLSWALLKSKDGVFLS